jgi:hypothetical protein
MMLHSRGDILLLLALDTTSESSYVAAD